MILPKSIAKDLRIALDAISNDKSEIWMQAAATMLEDCAARIRESVEQQQSQPSKLG